MFPPPPSERPRDAHALIDAATMVEVGEAISRGTPPSAALSGTGLTIRPSDIKRRAAEGLDPFWAWAASVLMMAEANHISLAGEVMHDLMHDEDPKVRFAAAKHVLSSRAEEYKPETTVVHEHAGEVKHSVAVDINRLLTGGKTDIRTLTQYQPDPLTLTDSQVPEEGAEDTDYEVLRTEPAPAHTPTHHPALGRRPMRKEDG